MEFHEVPNFQTTWDCCDVSPDSRRFLGLDSPLRFFRKDAIYEAGLQQWSSFRGDHPHGRARWVRRYELKISCSWSAIYTVLLFVFLLERLQHTEKTLNLIDSAFEHFCLLGVTTTWPPWKNHSELACRCEYRKETTPGHTVAYVENMEIDWKFQSGQVKLMSADRPTKVYQDWSSHFIL